LTAEQNGREDCECGKWAADVGARLAISSRGIPKEQRVGPYSIGFICPRCKRKVEVTIRKIHNIGTIWVAQSD
jgi:hypothetical protein